MSLLDINKLNRISGQLGSNPAGVFENDKGQRYYIKSLESVAHLRNEYIAAQIYQLAGVPTLNYQLTTQPDQLATCWIELEKKNIKHFNQVQRKQAKQWFAVHAWMANWDLAGFHGDNQGIANDKVITLDVGGALNFRAMGDPKGREFSTDVDEINSLRSNPDNPHAITLFGDMTQDEIAHSIMKVTSISEQKISDAILLNKGSQKLVSKMLARQQFLAKIEKSNL